MSERLSAIAVEVETLKLLRSLPGGKFASGAKVTEMPTDRLWMALAKITPAQRHKAVESLGHVARQRLNEFLLQRVHEHHRKQKTLHHRLRTHTL